MNSRSIRKMISWVLLTIMPLIPHPIYHLSWGSNLISNETNRTLSIYQRLRFSMFNWKFFNKYFAIGFIICRKNSQSWIRITPNFHDDGYAWRKYGQKVILNAKHQRYLLKPFLQYLSDQIWYINPLNFIKFIYHIHILIKFIYKYFFKRFLMHKFF